MNTKTQEALKELNKLLTEYHNGDLIQPFCKWTEDVLYKCKEALEQPAQEPVVFSESDLDMFQDNAERYNLTTTHPAPSWQGLSDNEIVSKWNEHFVGNTFKGIEFTRAIEQALKEKNHG